jgi:hypothetical protein
MHLGALLAPQPSNADPQMKRTHRRNWLTGISSKRNNCSQNSVARFHPRLKHRCAGQGRSAAGILPNFALFSSIFDVSVTANIPSPASFRRRMK